MSAMFKAYYSKALNKIMVEDQRYEDIGMVFMINPEDLGDIINAIEYGRSITRKGFAFAADQDDLDSENEFGGRIFFDHDSVYFREEFLEGFKDTLKELFRRMSEVTTA